MRHLLPWELDLRSLGAFRIALGLAMLVQIMWRLANVEWWYAPNGFAGQPLRDLIAGFPDVSPFAGAGTPTVTAALLISLLLATLLTLGISARLAALGLAVIFWALQIHNSTFLGNELTVMLWSLIWASMLPVDRAFSVRGQPLTETTVSSAAALGLTVQIGLVYTMNGQYKDAAEWGAGGVLKDVLAGGMYSRPPFSQALLSLPDPVLKGMTLGVLQLERVALPMLLLPLQWARLLIVLGLMAFHLGSALTMSVGLYPLMSLAWLTALLPPMIWGASTGVMPSWKPASSTLALALLIYTIWMNTAELVGGLSTPTRTLLQTAGIHQYWNNFSSANITTGIPVFAAQTRQGTVDLYRWAVTRDGTEIPVTLPADYNQAYGGRWWNWFAEPQRKLITNIVESKKYEAFAVPANFLCRKWNIENPEAPAATVQVSFISPQGKQDLWKGSCF